MPRKLKYFSPGLPSSLIEEMKFSKVFSQNIFSSAYSPENAKIWICICIHSNLNILHVYQFSMHSLIVKAIKTMNWLIKMKNVKIRMKTDANFDVGIFYREVNHYLHHKSAILIILVFVHFVTYLHPPHHQHQRELYKILSSGDFRFELRFKFQISLLRCHNTLQFHISCNLKRIQLWGNYKNHSIISWKYYERQFWAS